MDTPSENPIKQYAAITVSDIEDGKVTIESTHSDDLDPESELAAIAVTLHEEIAKGTLLPEMLFNTATRGMAMITIEEDTHESTDIEIILNPHVTIASGQLSVAQALAFSAMQRLQNTISAENMVVTDVVTSDAPSDDE